MAVRVLVLALDMFALVLLFNSTVFTQDSVMALKDVRKIFVEKMPSDLDQYINAEITKKFKGRVLVVLVPEQADAILTGTGEHKSGTGAAITGRFLWPPRHSDGGGVSGGQDSHSSALVLRSAGKT